jgi:hypothetical protein
MKVSTFIFCIICVLLPQCDVSESTVITLVWTSTTDHGTTYDIRCANIPSQLTNSWDECYEIDHNLTPSDSGIVERLPVYDLPAGLWYFAVKVKDFKGRWSEISNIAHTIIEY